MEYPIFVSFTNEYKSKLLNLKERFKDRLEDLVIYTTIDLYDKSTVNTLEREGIKFVRFEVGDENLGIIHKTLREKIKEVYITWTRESDLKLNSVMYELWVKGIPIHRVNKKYAFTDREHYNVLFTQTSLKNLVNKNIDKEGIVESYEEYKRLGIDEVMLFETTPENSSQIINKIINKYKAIREGDKDTKIGTKIEYLSELVLKGDPGKYHHIPLSEGQVIKLLQAKSKELRSFELYKIIEIADKFNLDDLVFAKNKLAKSKENTQQTISEEIDGI